MAIAKVVTATPAPTQSQPQTVTLNTTTTRVKHVASRYMSNPSASSSATSTSKQSNTSSSNVISTAAAAKRPVRSQLKQQPHQPASVSQGMDFSTKNASRPVPLLRQKTVVSQKTPTASLSSTRTFHQQPQQTASTRVQAKSAVVRKPPADPVLTPMTTTASIPAQKVAPKPSSSKIQAIATAAEPASVATTSPKIPTKPIQNIQVEPLSQQPDTHIPSNPRAFLEQNFSFLHKQLIMPDDKDSASLLANARLLQWQFLLAKAKSSFCKKEAEAERQLLQGWQTVQSLKDQIHSLKSEIAARNELESELNQLTAQESSLRKAQESITRFEKDYFELAKGLQKSVVRMELHRVSLSNPEEFRDCLISGATRVNEILDEGVTVFEKMASLSKAILSLENLASAECQKTMTNLDLLETVARLRTLQQSYVIEKEQLQESLMS
ncbi:hypothetical protein HDU77_011037 [Chytriomyces hyalinus]|nr:hypothetical protein HDU77_011037 [Chytriomyces hyalinus]